LAESTIEFFILFYFVCNLNPILMLEYAKQLPNMKAKYLTTTTTTTTIYLFIIFCLRF